MDVIQDLDVVKDINIIEKDLHNVLFNMIVIKSIVQLYIKQFKTQLN